MSFSLKIAIDPPNLLLVLDKRQVKKVMRQAGAEVAAAARTLLKGAAGNGRVYRGSGGAQYRPYKAGRYTASAPGGAPVSVTATLLRSIKVTPYRSGEGVRISSAFYGLFLEYGAKGGGTGKGARNQLRSGSNSRSRTLARTSRELEPRPFLTAALAARRESLSARIGPALAAGLSLQKGKP